MKILLAIDESKFSEAAVQAVATRFDPAGSDVMIVHALDLLSTYAGMSPIDPVALERIFDEERKAGEALVTRAQESLRAAGFKATWMLRKGDAKAVILDVAEEWKPDLLVVAAHGRKGFERFLLGSVSEAVARHARCTVEIVRTPR